MSHELFYTSAPRGLRRGTNGYCTVTATHGLPGLLGEQLERLSDYRPLFDGSTTARNPAAFSHLRVTALGKTYNVLSRIGTAGMDHTQRAIFFAHHVGLEAAELPPCGPAVLLCERGFLETRWDGQVRELPVGRKPKNAASVPSICHAWQQATGDAGWGGVLVDSYLQNPNRPVYLLYPSGLDPLPLLVEALALLPSDQRWRVTFSTLYRSVPQDVECAWRWLPLEAPEATKARTFPGAMVLDLSRTLGEAPAGPLVIAARTGKVPSPRQTPISAAPGLAPSAPLPTPATSWMEPASPVFRTRQVEEPLDLESFTPTESLPSPVATRRMTPLLPFALGTFLGMLLMGLVSVAAVYLLHRYDEDRFSAREKELISSMDAQKEEAEGNLKQKEKKHQQALESVERALNVAVNDRQMALDAKEEADRRMKAMQGTPGNLEKILRDDLTKVQEEKKTLDQQLKDRDQVLTLIGNTLFTDVNSKSSKDLKDLLDELQSSKPVDPRMFQESLRKIRQESLKNKWQEGLVKWMDDELGAFLFNADHLNIIEANLKQLKAMEKTPSSQKYKDIHNKTNSMCSAEKIHGVLVARRLLVLKEELMKLPNPK